MFLSQISTLSAKLATGSTSERNAILRQLDVLYRADYAGLPLRQVVVQSTAEDSQQLLEEFQFQGKWLLILMEHLRELTFHERQIIGPLNAPYTSESVTKYLQLIQDTKEIRPLKGFLNRFQYSPDLDKEILLQEEFCRQVQNPDKTISCGTGSLMHQLRYIPTGQFEMGAFDSDPNALYTEKPRHTVAIAAPFWMGVTPVSQKLYTAVMKDNPSQFPIDNNPVDNVRWIDAIVFCNRLSRLEGLTPCYPFFSAFESRLLKVTKEVASLLETALSTTPEPHSNGYRLPTEAEWEYAAKANHNSLYAGSDQIGDVAWYHDNSAQQSRPCGQKKTNAFGLSDMSGNVWEWCWDGWTGAPYSHPKNQFVIHRLSQSNGKKRVCRGGSWYDSAEACRVTHRLASSALSKDPGQGFRVVRNVIGAPKDK